MKYIKIFENFEVVEPIKYGDPLNPKEIKFLEGFNIPCLELILKDDGYYYVFDHRCEKIQDVPLTYIHGLCSKFKIISYTINEDFTIDVNGDVDLSGKALSKIPLKFNKVRGYFYCSFNDLTTLEGSPKEVGGDFFCAYSYLTTLEGGPERVGRDFNCYKNSLTTLEYGPSYIGGDFDFGKNPLRSTEYKGKVRGNKYSR